MQKKTPKVSVLMPAYNAEKYIAESIESILNQTFTDFEFVIINDGSTDNTAEIVEKYAVQDKRIKFVNNKKNQGLIAVLNQGLDLCAGEYIARFDSDDISRPTRLEKQVAYMDAHPECGVLGTWAQKFGTNVTHSVFKHPSQVKLLDMVMYGVLVVHPSAMLRKSVLVDNNIKYDPRYKYAEDFAFWAEMVKYSEIHNLQEILLDYRWHDGNISVVHKKTQQECAENIRMGIVSNLLQSEHDMKKFLRMTREVNERFYLFGFLPIIRRKQYSITKTKYYLFEKIPLIKEQDGKIYLFEFIKIGSLR